MKSPSRRSLLRLMMLGAPAAAYARLIEPAWLEMTERSCRIPNLGRPVSLVHLSDLHASTWVPNSLIEHAFDMAIAARPDLICLTGDFVTSASGFDVGWYRAALRRLAANAPTFAVLGNHDGGPWSASQGGFPTTAEIGRLVEGSGITLLANRSQKLDCHGAELQIAGVGDLWAGDLDARLAFQHVNPNRPAILLSHNPDGKDLLGREKWDLMLSGHTHGGQVVVPLIGLSPAPVEDRRYLAGLKPWRDRWIHVSRGVGSYYGVRFNCRPEVTLLRLVG